MSDYPHRVLDAVLASAVVPVSLRARLMRRVGYDVGARLQMYAGAHLGSRRVRFGDDVFVNRGLFCDARAPVTIGNQVAFGPHVRLVTVTHDIGPAHERCVSTPIALPIVIEDGCWLAAGVIVLPGVRVRRGCVIGAGAVVTTSTEPDGLYVGVPARRVRDLPGPEDALPPVAALSQLDR